MYKLSQIPEEYKKKLITAEQAAALVKDGDRVSYGLGCAAPYDIDIEIGKRAKELHGVEIVATTVVKDEPYAAYLNSDSNEQIRFATAHMNGFERKMSKDGRCWFIPILFNELPKYWENIDKLIIQVHPMDQWGNFNLGPQASDLRGLIRAAKTIILEVNQNMPKALGYETELNLCDVDYVVEGSNHPMPQIPNRAGTPVDDKIADYIIPMIEDGSTLQLGIGGIPNAVAEFLKDKNDLGIHTELITSGMADLVKTGVVTNKRKNINKGQMVATMILGNNALYEFCDRNPGVALYDGAWVNDPYVIAQNDNQISINTSLEVDLTGQCASESIGSRQFSGTGGQADTAIGAQMSKGGRSIIALYSTAMVKDKATGERHEVSKIVSQLQSGAAVSLSRNDVDLVITEYGAADLRGANINERVRSLIEIAHPKFRDELLDQALSCGIIGKK